MESVLELKPIKIGPQTFDCPTMMAPMCGISDSPWRRMVRRFGVGLVCTEMTSSEALIRDKERSYQLLSHHAEETPLMMQLCGSEPEVLAEAAKKVQSL